MSDRAPSESERSAGEAANQKLGNLPGGPTVLSNSELGKEILTEFEENAKLSSKNTGLEMENRTDHLTGLPNGRAYDEMLLGLEDKWQRLKRNGEVLFGSFIAADLTGLKNVNDDPEMGHDVGDKYLKEGGKILLDVLRQSDRVFRLGDNSDEYVVHLSGPISKEESMEIKHRINQSFEVEQSEFRHNYPKISMSVSMSYTSYGSEVNPMEASRNALNKLAEAKRKKEIETGKRGEKVEVPD